METTLCYFLNGNKVLMGEKKRGFAKGTVIGIGGKLNENETPEQAFIRETEEEIMVTPVEFKERAIIWFDSFYKDKKVFYPCHVFVVTKWIGEPQETDEIRPVWFDKNNLPFDKMFSDDKLWLERVLNGEQLECKFKFNEDFKLLDFSIETKTIKKK